MFRTAMALSTLALVSLAAAHENNEARGMTVSVEYQYLRTGEFTTNFGTMDIGRTDAHVLLLAGTYSLGPRWTIFGSIPYVQKRHQGQGAHNPNVDFTTYIPPDRSVVDDGNYHGGFQDMTVGIRYETVEGPFLISPFLSYGAPMSKYPIYGNAAIGKRLRELAAGVSLELTPYFSDWVFQLDISHVFSEKVLDVDLDYWYWYASASYFLTPRLAPRVFLVQRDAPNGLTFPEDFILLGIDNEWWYQHDRTMKHNFLNGGIGLNYLVNDQYAMQVTYFRTIEPDNVVEVDHAITLGLTYRF